VQRIIVAYDRRDAVVREREKEKEREKGNT